MKGAETNKNVQRIVEAATTLVIIGVGLNIVVTQTLGSLSAASVLLALYVAFWAYVVGSLTLIVLSIGLLVMKKSSPAEPTIAKAPQADGCVGQHVFSGRKAA